MSDKLLWSIGSEDGRSSDLVDTFKEPNKLGDVVWRVSEAGSGQKWPLYHPSEADPEAGYRSHPYTIEFSLDEIPAGDCVFAVQYLVIQPRLARLGVEVNGTAGRMLFRPEPSKSGEIRLQSGLHTTIYSEGKAEVIIPRELLCQGQNKIVLMSVDDRAFIHVDRIEAIKRLDRMANSAGFLYQHLTFSAKGETAEVGTVRRAALETSVLYRRNASGELRNPGVLHVEFNHPLKEAAELQLELSDGGRRETQTLQLPAVAFGHAEAEFELFEGVGQVDYRLSGTISGEPFEQNGTLKRKRKWNVYITPHAHTDIGYTHRQWEVAERLCRNIDTALDYLENGAEDAFTYHLDSAWALETYLVTRGDERKRQLLKWLKAGRVSIAANYVDLLTQFAALEDLIRNGELTEAYLRPEGMRSDFATVVDVASITGSVPAIYEGSGVKYLVHANNQDRGPFRLNSGLHRISPFYWEGVNGGRVLCWLSKMYCELRKVCGSPPMVNAAERGLGMWLAEYEKEDYAPDAVMLYGQEADNTDLDPQPVDFVKEWNATYEYPKLIPCDVSEFFRYVEENFGHSLKTVKGDSGAYWEDGVGSSITESIEARHAQAALPAAERLEALALVHNPEWRFPKEHFDEAWRELLLYDEHTWGAFLSGPEPEAWLAKDQWAIKEHMAKSAVQWSQRLLHSAAVRNSLCWNNDGREVVVYNPHSWTFAGTVRVEIAPNEKVYDADGSTEIPTRKVKVLPSQMVVELWVEALAGLSYRRFVLKPAEAAAVVAETALGGSSSGTTSVSAAGVHGSTVVLENRFYRVELDLAKGFAVSVYDKELGRDLADRTDEWGFGQLLYARGGEGTRLLSNQSDLPDGNPEVLGEFSLTDFETETFDYGSRAVLRGSVPYGTVEIEWTLSDQDKRIDVHFAYTKEERREKEAVYVAFPFNQPDGADVLSDSQLGWVNWDKDQLPGGCKEWLPLQTGILVRGGEADVLIASPDIPLFCVGTVVEGKWPKEKDLTGGRIFSYVLNNYWYTNYKGSQGGRIEFGYRLTSRRSISPEAAYRFGWETRRPHYAHRMSFQDFRETKPAYSGPTGGTLADIGGESIVLSAMKQAKWDDGLVVRLQEIAGQDGETRVSFPGRRIVRAWACDLLERDEEQLPVNADGTLRVKVPAWGLATVRLEMEGGGR